MKILDVYHKNDDIRFCGKNVFVTMDEFFKGLPLEYGKCYYRNLADLELVKVENLDGGISTGRYIEELNKIFFEVDESVGHELMHVAFYDQRRRKSSIESDNCLYTQGFIEGMVEYQTMNAYGLSRPYCYDFEVFNIQMLENIPNLSIPFFMPSHDDFINLFPNKGSIYNLMYAINYYHEAMFDFMGAIKNKKENEFDVSLIRESIKDTIDRLITIELLYEESPESLMLYYEKFMDLIGSENISSVLRVFYPEYKRYANKEIKRRIRMK